MDDLNSQVSKVSTGWLIPYGREWNAGRKGERKNTLGNLKHDSVLVSSKVSDLFWMENSMEEDLKSFENNGFTGTCSHTLHFLNREYQIWKCVTLMMTWGRLGFAHFTVWALYPSFQISVIVAFRGSRSIGWVFTAHSCWYLRRDYFAFGMLQQSCGINEKFVYSFNSTAMGCCRGAWAFSIPTSSFLSDDPHWLDNDYRDSISGGAWLMISLIYTVYRFGVVLPCTARAEWSAFACRCYVTNCAHDGSNMFESVCVICLGTWHHQSKWSL